MAITTLIPIVLFVVTLAALVYLRYRDYASLTKEEKAQLEREESEKARSAVGGRVASLAEKLNELMPALISLIVLASSLYIILSVSYGEAEKKWAYGSGGTILGYWLRSTVKSRSGRARS